MKTARTKPKTGRLELHNSNKYIDFYAYYTIVFVIVFLLVFCWYIFFDKTFIWQKDGWSQYYRAMVYYGRYLRKIALTLLVEHKFHIPQWDFSFGEGNDVLQALHYYIIGDPFNIPAALFPTKYMWIYYNFSIFLRMYISGIGFSWLCFYTKKDAGKFAVMAGTVSYVFCFWAIYYASNPIFINPLVIFPFVILGVEKIINNERPYILVLSVFLSACSNFYFFYMTVILTVIYILVRAFVLYKKELSKIIGLVFKVGLFSLLGTAMAAVILVPICYDFLSDARMGTESNFFFHYPLEYYLLLPSMFLSGKVYSWLGMGYSSSVVLGSILLLSKKGENKTLKILFLISTVIILFPVFGQVLNGMSYVSNRWCWSLALLCCYASVVIWPKLMKAKRRDVLIMLSFIAVAFVCSIIGKESRTFSAFSEIVIALLFVVFLIMPKKSGSSPANQYKTKQTVALLIVIVSITNMSYFCNAPSTYYFSREFIETKGIEENLLNNETTAIKSVAKGRKDGFYRFSTKDFTFNSGTLAGLSATNYYWSISNPKIAEFVGEMELVNTVPQFRKGYDNRTAIDALSSVKYHTVKDGDSNSRVPYGYKYITTVNVNEELTNKTKEELAQELGVKKLTKKQERIIERKTAKNYAVFRNKYSLPLGYTYKNTFGDDVWYSLSPVEKQEAMLQGLYINGSASNYKPDTASKSIEYQIECKSDKVEVEDNKFTVLSDNGTIILWLDGLKKSETYFRINGLDYKGFTTYDLYNSDKIQTQNTRYSKTMWNLLPATEKERFLRNKINYLEPKKTNITISSSTGYTNGVDYYTNKFPWYTGVHDYTVNMGYSAKPVNYLVITFPEKGVYSFDSIDVICQPFNNYKEQINALKEDTLKKVKIKGNTVSGEITLDEEKYLCLSIPYSQGWSAYVDGEEAEIMQANTRNMALKLSPGKHSVKLIYRTPMLKQSFMVSAISILALAALIIGEEIIAKRKKKQIQ